MITIIIPLYNKEKYIGTTIESVLKQTCEEWELIIVDDGSKDKSLEIVKKYSKENSSIKVLQRKDIVPDIKGANICRNLGMKYAIGDFLIFLDADDLMMDYCIEERVNMIDKYPGKDMYIFNVAYCKGEVPKPYTKLKPGKTEYFNYLLHKNKRKYFLGKFLKFDLPWHTSGPIWRKEFIRDLGGFDLEFQRLQDPEIHTKALLEEDIKLRSLLFECKYDILHRKDEDREVWTKEEFFEKQFGAIKKYIKKFVPILSDGGLKNSLSCLEGYFLEAEKLVYRHKKEGGEFEVVTKELNSLYLIEEFKKVATWRYYLFRKVYGFFSGKKGARRMRIPGMVLHFYKKMI